MHENYEHNPNDHEDPMSGPTWMIGAVGAIILIVILFGVTAVLKSTEVETTDEVIVQGDITELTQVHLRDAQRLESPPRQVEYLDENGEKHTRIAIPIEDAMKFVAQQWEQQPQRPQASAVGGR